MKTIKIALTILGMMYLLFLPFKIQDEQKKEEIKEAENYAKWLLDDVIIPMTEIIENRDKVAEKYTFGNMEELVETDENASQFFSNLLHKAEKREIKSKELQSLHHSLISYLEARGKTYSSYAKFLKEGDLEAFTVFSENDGKFRRIYPEFLDDLYKYLDETGAEFVIPNHNY